MNRTDGWPLGRAAWAEFSAMAARVAGLDRATPVRLIAATGRQTALAKLPSGALVSRQILCDASRGEADVTARAGELSVWFDDPQASDPARADAAWRGMRPPESGWARVEQVPADVVRELVQQGARAHVTAAQQGLGARAAETLLDSPVLTVSGAGHRADLTNRSLSGVVSMGFLPADGYIIVSVARGWTRVAAQFGNAYAEPVFTTLVLA